MVIAPLPLTVTVPPLPPLPPLEVLVTSHSAFRPWLPLPPSLPATTAETLGEGVMFMLVGPTLTDSPLSPVPPLVVLLIWEKPELVHANRSKADNRGTDPHEVLDLMILRKDFTGKRHESPHF